MTRDKRGGGRGLVGGTKRTKGEEEGTSRGDGRRERETVEEGGKRTREGEEEIVGGATILMLLDKITGVSFAVDVAESRCSFSRV